jgi:hypothetical protein
MPAITISLTDAEHLALGYVAQSPTAWIDNAVHERCRIAMDEIIEIAVKKCLDNKIQIPGTREDIVNLAFSQGWVVLAEQRNNTGPY